MKILISETPDEGLELEIAEPLEIDVLKLISPARGNLNLKKVGIEVIIEGDVTVEAELECSRCLKNFTDTVHVPINVVYRPVEELKTGNKHEIREDELDTEFYSGDELDVHELLREQITLSIPMKSLCSESCKGICQKCGIDLNMGNCGCNGKDLDPRFEALKKLLAKGAKDSVS